MKDRLLTTTEVAEFLSMNVWQVRHYIKTGLLQAYKVGNGTIKKGSRREWRIWEKDLIAFINRSGNIKDTRND